MLYQKTVIFIRMRSQKCRQIAGSIAINMKADAKKYLIRLTNAVSLQTVEKVAETTRIYKSEHFSLFSTIPK